MAFNPGPSARHPEKIELLLFKSGDWLFGSRTTEVSGLARAEISPLAPPSRAEQIALPPRLEHAFLGWLKGQAIPIFRLDSLLDLETARFDLGRVILIHYGTCRFGLAVEQVFEVQSVSLHQLKLLPPLIELTLERPSVWLLLHLNSPLNIGGQEMPAANPQTDQLVSLLDFPGLFSSEEQLFLTNWL